MSRCEYVSVVDGRQCLLPPMHGETHVCAVSDEEEERLIRDGYGERIATANGWLVKTGEETEGKA